MFLDAITHHQTSEVVSTAPHFHDLRIPWSCGRNFGTDFWAPISRFCELVRMGRLPIDRPPCLGYESYLAGAGEVSSILGRSDSGSRWQSYDLPV